MTKRAKTIHFKATLLRPAKPKRATWFFLVLPAGASAKLPTRSMVAVEGLIGSHPIKAMLEPDGKGSHWLKVSREMREAAGIGAGDIVVLELAPAAAQPEPAVPADLRKALAMTPDAKALWCGITAIARREWIHWITSAKKAETRERRIVNACAMLASGKRRACCFDRSGIYSKTLQAPEAASRSRTEEQDR